MFRIGFSNKSKTVGARARQLQVAWAVRALIIAAVLGGLAALSIWLLTPVETTKNPPASRLSREFSDTTRPDQLLKAIQGSEAAYRIYLQRDRVFGDFAAIAHEFRNIKSDSDLMQFLRMLGSSSGDEYFAVLTNQQYEHITAQAAGAKIGVDFELDYSSSEGFWKTKNVGKLAEAAGLKNGDRIYSVNGYLALFSDDSNQRTIYEQQLNMRLMGWINTPIEVVVVRDQKQVAINLRVQVISREDAFTIDDMDHPLDKEQSKGLKMITFKHLYSSTLLTDLEQVLRTWQANNVRAVGLDLRKLSEGDPEIAIRVAAMFREKGVISRVIRTTSEGDLIMETWEIVDGRVQLKTRGPFKVGADGNLVTTRSVQEKVEVKDWPTNVCRVPHVAVLGRGTSGVGELFAASISESWRVEKRGMTVAKVYTWGKGTQQTYFPIGNGYWFRLSTAFYLQPNGSNIEGRLGPGPNVACPSSVNDEWWFAKYTLLERFNVVPLPEWPGGKR